jgi:hypothetical protein
MFGFFVLGIINMPHLSYAESQIEIQEGDISVQTTPSNPGPYQSVTIDISSYATDLNKAMIMWNSDGQTVLSGIGKTEYSFTTKGPDITNTIDINIQPVGSMTTIDKVVSITPQEIEMMWESVDGYTPPFYKGKSLPTVGGNIRVVAVPSTNTIKSGSGSITYTWKNGDNVIPNDSGYNKNSYVFKDDMFSDNNQITVTASSVDGSYVAENTVDIPIYQPQIVFYEKSPTEGVLYNNALTDNFFMSKDEMTVVAEPYFFVYGKNNISYSWEINGSPIDTPSGNTELTVKPNSRGGYATVGLTMENLDELFQKVSNLVKINL